MEADGKKGTDFSEFIERSMTGCAGQEAVCVGKLTGCEENCCFMGLKVQESQFSIRLSQFIKMSMKHMDLRNVNCLFFMK